MRAPVSSLVPLVLFLTTAVFANPFWFRADEPAEDATSTTIGPSTTAAEATASATGTAPPAAESSTNGTAVATQTSNGTAAATTTSSEGTPTPTATCHKSSSLKPAEDISNPFCEPEDGQTLKVGQTYPLSWDPSLFEFNSTNTVELQNSSGSVIWSHVPVANEEGQVNDFTMYPYYLQPGKTNDSNLTLFIHSVDADENPTTKSGPVFTLITNATDSQNGTSHGDNNIGEKAGIPVGLGVFLIAAAGLIFWLLRRRRNKSAGYMAKRKGVSRMTGDGESGVGGGFRDEPTRGMELQDRMGHGRQDSWEAGWDTSSSQGGGGGNTFRDEIDRQRRR
ncbi:MAG: hypothetical protein Q9166_006453 [cf. Caloplaca sp. 2 TL-2023]